MSDYVRKLFERDRLRIALSVSAFFLIFITAIPLSVFMLYNDLQDSVNKQYSVMEARVENMQNTMTEKNSLDSVPESFFDGFGYSGEKIAIDENIDNTIERVIVLPAEKRDIKDIDRHILSFFSPMLYQFLNYPENAQYKREVKNLPIVVQDNGRVLVNAAYTFEVNSVPYEVMIQKDVTSNITIPFDTFTLNLVIMIFWFMLLAAIAVFFFLRVIFKPLEEGITTATERLDTENFHIKIPDPHYGQEVTRVVEVFNGLLDKCGDLVEQNANMMQDISHEVRTHLTAIKQSVDIIKMYGADDQELVLARMSSIETNIVRATDIMTTILNLAKLKQGTQFLSDEQYPANFFGFTI